MRPDPTAPRSRSFRRAMTLVEILAVVVILGLIAATLLVGFSGSFGRAKLELARTGIGVLAGQVEKFKIETGQWPTNDIGLAALSDGNATAANAFYVQPSQLNDPWKRPYVYITPGPAGQPFEIVSYGADGQPGGEGENTDISSANLGGDE